jgi:heme-degrading monooxygenase HmoA
MFLRLYWSRLQPGAWEAVHDLYRRDFSKMNVPGRLARWVTRDTNDPDCVITVTLWENQDAIQAWESSEQYARSIVAIRPHLVGSQTVSLCEVELEYPSGLLQALHEAAERFPLSPA